MASIRKTVQGTWRAFINTKGVRDSQTFSTKAQASAWANDREQEIRSGAGKAVVIDRTVSDLLEKYGNEVSPGKRGSDWEAVKLAAIAKHSAGGNLLGQIKLNALTPVLMALWRDNRLKTVGNATVNREIKLLNHAFNIAINEWNWITTNPLTKISRPKNPPPRDRRISAEEIQRLDYVLGFDNAKVTKSGRVAVAFHFAIETAMRLSEICNLTPGDISGRVATLPQTKNGSRREVPLSPRALHLLTLLPENEQSVFGLTPASVDALFRKAKAKAGLNDLHFHDTRHEAITRLAGKLNVLELARMVGHKDLKMLMVYYNASAEDLAGKL